MNISIKTFLCTLNVISFVALHVLDVPLVAICSKGHFMNKYYWRVNAARFKHLKMINLHSRNPT